MDDYLLLILFSLIGGLFSLAGGVVLLARPISQDKLIKYAMPFAAGALLAAVFLDLLPEGVEEGGLESKEVFLGALIGILGFFIAERFLRWFHHHHEDDHRHTDPATSLIVVGDTIHNALDGVAIAAAFLVSIPTGIVTTVAVAAHEIPQEIGDFGLLLAKGVRRSTVVMINVLSSLATTLAAVATYALGSSDKLPLALLLGLSAGFLLYIAMSDIIPTIHQKSDFSKLVQAQVLLLIVGVVTVGFSILAAHDYLDSGHTESPHTSQHH